MHNGAIVLPHDEWRKIHEYTAVWPDEVACMGYAKLENGNVIVDEVFLVPQFASLHGVDFVAEGLNYAVQKAAKENRIDELRFCWHSHATHGAFFSATDEDMVRKIRDAGPIPWLASAVLNKKGDTHGQIDYFDVNEPLSDFANHITVQLDVCSELDLMAADGPNRIEEIEAFVTKKYAKKAAASTASTSKRGGTDHSTGGTEPGQANRPVGIGGQAISSSDWKLLNEGRSNDWECYIDHDFGVAYFWDKHFEFKGSATIPVDEKEEYRVELNETIVDGSAHEIEPDSHKLIPIHSMTDEMIERAENMGQV